LIVSLPKLMNVILILLLLLFLFSVMGMHMFALVHVHGPHGPHANFATFGMSLMTLIRCMTGEGWNEIMHSLMKNSYELGHLMAAPCIDDFLITADNYARLEERCLLANPVACGKPKSAVFFFVTYSCVITFIILNLFVAVVLEGFDQSNSGEDDVTVEKCVEVWKKFDPDLLMKLDWLKATAFVEVALIELEGGPKVDPKSKAKQARFAVQQASISRMEIDEEGNVSFKSATLAVKRLLMPTEELIGVLKLSEVAEQEELLNQEKQDIRAQVAALAVQAVFRRRQAERRRRPSALPETAGNQPPAGAPGTPADNGGGDTLVGAMSTPSVSPERGDAADPFHAQRRLEEFGDQRARHAPEGLPPGVPDGKLPAERAMDAAG